MTGGRGGKKGKKEVGKGRRGAEAEVDAAEHTKGATPLFIASLQGHTKVVQLLLAAKADVNVRTLNGDTALSIAKKRGHKRVVDLLREHGAKE